VNDDSIREALEELGYTLSDKGAYWQTNALYRGGDNRTALQIYKNSGTWKDYVKDTPFLPFKSLVEATLKTNDPNIIKSFIKDSPSLLARKYNPEERISCEKIYEDSVLDNLLPHYKYYNRKGISDLTLIKTRSGLATKGQMYQRFVFPIFNENLKIHGFSGRLITIDSNKPKWKHMGKKSSWIYPFYIQHNQEFFVKDSILSSGEVFLVESIGDLLSLHERGIYNVLVIFGLDVSSKICCLLSSLNLDKIHLSLNNDADKEENRGLNGSIKNLLKLLNLFSIEKLRISLPVKNDFGDMNDSDFDEWEEKIKQPSSREYYDQILNTIESQKRQKKIPKSLLKNVKFLH
tara:strand:+ start:10428 stop:11471 length:1044 start_codon:yes stop_codon:yes gene_type:complete